ncbi:Putative uncharacterized protein [Taphrina deformans PYCC 5710]|uniref:Uncharacterized protein n=1 Tax=Taphrina deformans (strain PYCC 5710 / ATCC 11124 / CBS 356.35 / IMI 108563 / JCM 9778 / NBRC 8474) TaxID=1097556 RepID=R4XE01_TAPDE|nr:Putative uncharacterized protein [Taphrina deformans PYCC 5710]|eukprot:CCG82645.1 Putative uncharacterized protein [Taphrina deformans PYCC 5710]
MLVPFIALLGSQGFPISYADATEHWNVSAPRGAHSFDYGTYPLVSGDYFRNVPVANCHSHNDYWRDVPLFTGLSHGCYSTEADVWLFNGTLLVGHDVASLRSERTFSSLYIDPLVAILDQKNPVNQYVSFAEQLGHVEKNGVFDTNSAQTLQLLVDVKTDGEQTWPYVVAALEPLRTRGYLSFVNQNDTEPNSRAVTVIGTGNTPLEYLLARPERDYFFDAPLAALNSTFTPSLSPLASTSLQTAVNWLGIFPATATQLDILETYITQAHAQGLKTRIWDNPSWPRFARDRVWLTFLDLGVDLLNADDLQAVTSL